MRVVHNSSHRVGYTARRVKASGYFYFHFGAAANWLDRVVSCSQDQQLNGGRSGVEEYRRLKKLNEQIVSKAPRTKPGKKRSGATR